MSIKMRTGLSVFVTRDHGLKLKRRETDVLEDVYGMIVIAMSKKFSKYSLERS